MFLYLAERADQVTGNPVISIYFLLRYGLGLGAVFWNSVEGSQISSPLIVDFLRSPIVW